MTEIGSDQPPRVQEAIELHAEDIAIYLNKGTPGETRVSLRVTPEGAVRVYSQDKTEPLPELQEGELVFWTICEAMDWEDERQREWWLSGEGVIEEGIETFDHVREGPADAAPTT